MFHSHEINSEYLPMININFDTKFDKCRLKKPARLSQGQTSNLHQISLGAKKLNVLKIPICVLALRRCCQFYILIVRKIPRHSINNIDLYAQTMYSWLQNSSNGLF